jgi:NAD(P)H-dependent flavin oxidoreductase YrpB (nitropropane dioxygenase family)
MTATGAFLEKLGITVPIVLAPMGGAVGPELTAAVSNAGGLGIIPLWREDADITGQAAAVRALTAKPFGINLNNNYPQERHLADAIAADVMSISFFWGIDAKRIRLAKDAGIVVMQTIGSAAEAKQAVETGADIVVAQGWEAGGHVWSTVANLALIPAVVDAVPGTPVIAAGGIADGRGVAAVLALGASAAWIGTRFLLAHEARVDAARRAKVAAANEADTLMGKDANATWHDSAIRWIAQPRERWTYEYGPDDRQLAGQSVGMVTRSQPAAAMVAEIWAEAQTTIKGLQRLV